MFKIKANEMTAMVVASVHTLTAYSDSLPSCKSSDATKKKKKIVNRSSYRVGNFIELNDIEEVGFNKNSEIRLCVAELTTTHGVEDVNYSVRWQNKETKQFYVEVR